jgi:hypothetical protein
MKAKSPPAGGHNRRDLLPPLPAMAFRHNTSEFRTDGGFARAPPSKESPPNAIATAYAGRRRKDEARRTKAARRKSEGRRPRAEGSPKTEARNPKETVRKPIYYPRFPMCHSAQDLAKRKPCAFAAAALSHPWRRISRSVWTAAFHRRFVGRPNAPARPFGFRPSDFGLLSALGLRTSDCWASDCSPEPPLSGRAGQWWYGQEAPAGRIGEKN